MNHRCFIQPIADEEDLSDSEDAEEEQRREFEEAENGGLDDGEMLEPMICAMDSECTTDEMKEFEVVRVGWKYLGESDSYKETETAKDVLRDAKARTNENGKERKVYVYAHNMRGFDSSFILHALYDLGYQIVKVLSVGANYFRLSAEILFLAIL